MQSKRFFFFLIVKLEWQNRKLLGFGGAKETFLVNFTDSQNREFSSELREVAVKRARSDKQRSGTPLVLQ